MRVQKQGRDQEAQYPPPKPEKLRKKPQGKGIPQCPQEADAPGAYGANLHAPQRPGEAEQQPIHHQVVQQKPFQADPHATSTTMTVMSSGRPRSMAADSTPWAMDRGEAVSSPLSSPSSSLPIRS